MPQDPGRYNTEKEDWNHDPGDLGGHGESHDWYEDGSGHHTIWREDGSRISWDTDENGDYSGGGHTVNSDGSKSDWS